MKTIEIFGNIYEEVEDCGSMVKCKLCAMREYCRMTDPDIICKKADGSCNRHFVLVNEKLNEEE